MAEGSKFQWHIEDCGYRVTDGEEIRDYGVSEHYRRDEFSKEKRFIVPTILSGHTCRTYEPLNVNPMLYREFTSTEPTESGFVSFADRFGFLQMQKSRSLRNPPIYESVDTWQYAHKQMRFAVKLWDAAEKEDIKYLKSEIKWWQRELKDSGETIIWVECGVFYCGYQVHTPRAWRSRTEVIEIREVCRPGELVLPAKLFCLAYINRNIERSGRKKLKYNRETGMIENYYVPYTLIAAIWNQFGDAVSSNRRGRRCEQCGSWFEQKRSTKKYCSETCRARAFKARQANGNGNGHSAGSEKD